MARTTSTPDSFSKSRNWAPMRGLKSRSLYCPSRRSKRRSRSMMPLKPICLMKRAARSASSGLSTTYAFAVMPACGGQERTLTPVNRASGAESASKHACTIQSSASSLGRYSWRITPGCSPQSRARVSRPSRVAIRVVPLTAGRLRRTNASRFLATTGKRAVSAKATISSYDSGNAAAGLAMPCSTHSSCRPCLLASLRGSAGSTRGKRKEPASSSWCSAIRTAASSSVGIRTAGRPIRRPMRSRPSTRWPGSSAPVVGQTNDRLR